MGIFNQLKFKKEDKYTDSIKNTEWEFFIPGVNSGVYKPASLHILVRIKENKAGFFKLKESISYSNITLTSQQFDELYNEMIKIKELRDNKILNK